jgi:hypothetical protein
VLLVAELLGELVELLRVAPQRQAERHARDERLW